MTTSAILMTLRCGSDRLPLRVHPTPGFGLECVGPTPTSMIAELAGSEPFDQSSISRFGDAAFEAAGAAIGTNRPGIGGRHADSFPTLATTPGNAEGGGARSLTVEGPVVLGSVPTLALAVTTEPGAGGAGPSTPAAPDTTGRHVRGAGRRTDSARIAEEALTATAAHGA